MTAKKLLLLSVLMVCQILCAQQDSIALTEVIVSDSQLQKFSNSQSVLTLNDSVLRKNQPFLTSLLNFNSVIYFKENGLGMVSSPSFRGTTAQQTAVIWNGININSQLLGQTDFNTITTRDFNSVEIRAGGGSAIYGSSAIGGSIHLNNDLVFKKHFENDLYLGYGSFNTFGGNYKLSVSDGTVSAAVSVSRNSSDNDYEYLQNDGENLNGQYYNTSISGNFGYKINDNNFLKLYSQFFESERHFSLIFPSEIKTKYRDLNTRNMLEWDSFFSGFTSKVKVAALSENYQYFANINSDNFSHGEVETLIGKYDLAYKASEKVTLNTIFDYTQNKGMGSDLQGRRREIGSATLLFKHQIFEKLLYELTVRKEITENYKSPLLFSVGTNYKILPFYNLKINGSRNFRIPTFNDLYWNPGGNENLKPESSYQGEIGNVFAFKNFHLSITGYYNKISDMIVWLPNGNFWSPQNINKVNTYGGEAILGYKKNFGIHHFALNATYAYTISENDETKKQLIYVPFHKANGTLSYSVKKISADYQYLFNGEVFTRADNQSRYNIDAYFVNNLMLAYDFGKSKSYKIGVQIRNIWNEKYASVESRYLPGRNYNIYLNLNF